MQWAILEELDKGKNMKIKKRYIILPIAVIAIGLACKKVVDDQQADELVATVTQPIKTVEVAAVKPIKLKNEVYAIGRLASKQEVKLSFKTGGLIKRINANEGQTVAAGTILAELDMEEINAQVQQASVGQQQAEIQLKSAQLMVEKLERDFTAVKALYEDKVATLTELKDTKSALDNAKNQVEAARTGMRFSDEGQKIAKYNQRLSKITAPTAGIILKRLSEPNEIVGPGAPIFIFGSKNDALVLKASVTDKDIVHLNLGNSASVKFDAYPDRLFNGKISEIAGIADPYTGTYEIEIALDRSTAKLLSGFIGEASISSSVNREILSIPINAMLNANGSKAKVLVVEDGVVRSKNIRIGSIQGEALVVLDGLSAGDLVITRGANYVATNDSVNTEMK